MHTCYCINMSPNNQYIGILIQQICRNAHAMIFEEVIESLNKMRVGQQYSSFCFLQRCAVLYGSVLELGCGNLSFQLFSESFIWQGVYLSLDTAVG